MFWKENGGLLELPGWRKMKPRRDLEITRDCTTIVHTYLLCIFCVTVYPHNSVLNTDCPPVSESQGYIQSSWVSLAPDAFPGLSLHVTDGFPDLLPNLTWLLVAQAHSVVVSRVHAFTGCWPETISGHRFLYEATHVMVTCFL